MKHTSFFILFLAMALFLGCKKNHQIDRYKLVTRHNIEHSSTDSLSSLSIGNGRFAFTADITGLQTFPGNYIQGVPLGTMAEWGWQTRINTQNYTLADVYKEYDVHGRKVDYVRQFQKNEDSVRYLASEWLRANPHKIHLGIIGLSIIKEDGSEISLDDVANPVQKLNLWTGMLESRFEVEGNPVLVETNCHPSVDAISARISSPLISKNRLKIKISFPVDDNISFGFGRDLTNDGNSELTNISADFSSIKRTRENFIYNLSIHHKNGLITESDKDEYSIEPASSDSVFSFSCSFIKENQSGRLPDFIECSLKSAESWRSFWMNGAAVDFSECSDSRAFELERRVILSRYLTRIQCSGLLPPAETGLTYNSWYGKFHLEMHWWHSVHFALWGYPEILAKQMDYYFRIFDNAKKTAEHQGYNGVRWPKMVGPDGMESPSRVGTYLIWQQPHPIFYSELLYINSDNRKEVLNKYSKLVFETAEFMSSYAWLDSLKGKYVLGPVLIPAQESLKLETTINPPFELVYWYWGLKTAIKWKERINEIPPEKWVDIVENISDLPVLNGLYLCSEDTRDSYTNSKYMSDHPIVSGIKGVLPDTRLVDDDILSNSLDTILKVWNWKSTWGWDFPMLAMSAAAMERYELAVDFLLMDAPKNRYLRSGHNYQDSRLTIYLPGNGGLLTAVAKMCTRDQFPQNGEWKVKWENLNNYVE